MPLVFGTLKGTFYAMLLAVPLALGAAAYVSHFTTPAFRAWIKPAIEMMACVPSVVLGFLVGLWLAPVIKDGLLAFFLSVISDPAGVRRVSCSSGNRPRKSPAARTLRPRPRVPSARPLAGGGSGRRRRGCPRRWSNGSSAAT